MPWVVCRRATQKGTSLLRNLISRVLLSLFLRNVVTLKLERAKVSPDGPHVWLFSTRVDQIYYWWSLRCGLTSNHLTHTSSPPSKLRMGLALADIHSEAPDFLHNESDRSPDQMRRMLTDDSSPYRRTFLIPYCPPHKCATAICPKCVLMHKASYIEGISLKWAGRK